MNLSGYVFRIGISENVPTQKHDFERRLQDLQIFKKFYILNSTTLYSRSVSLSNEKIVNNLKTQKLCSLHRTVRLKGTVKEK